MMRFIAVAILLIPGVISAFGIKLMRDAIFSEYFSIFFNASIQFIIGLLLFLGGLLFIGGFIVHRDKKKNLVRKRE